MKTCSLQHHTHEYEQSRQKIKELKDKIHEAVEYRFSPVNLMLFSKTLAIALNKDLLELQKNKEYISLLSIAAPRRRCSVDDQTRIAHKIAYGLMYLSNNSEKWRPDRAIDRKWADIEYSKSLKILRENYDRWEEEKLKKKWEVDKHKKARGVGEEAEKAFCELKKKMDLSLEILQPTAMSVDITPEEDFRPVFAFLEENKACGLTQFIKGTVHEDGRLDLCKQVVGPPSIGALMKSLRKNQHTKHFLLGNNVVGTVGAQEIASYILDQQSAEKTGVKSKIETWYLAGNDIDSKGVAFLASAFEKDTYVKDLWLKRNPLGPEGGKAIGKMLSVNSSLLTLDLVNTGLLDEGFLAVLEGLSKNTSVEHLYLDANNITSKSMPALSSYLAETKRMKSLFLDINRIGDEGAEILSVGLAKNKTLERLYLGSNRLEEKGVQAICKALTDHPKISVLSFGAYKSTADMKELCNRMRDNGLEHVLSLLQANKNLCVLDLTNNGLSLKGIERLDEVMTMNTNILHLAFDQLGLKIPVKTREHLDTIVDINCRRVLMTSHQEFLSSEGLRRLKHTPNINVIDSIYRNAM